MSEFAQAVADYGLSIVAVFALAYYVFYQNKQHNEYVEKSNKEQKEQVEKITNEFSNRVQVITDTYTNEVARLRDSVDNNTRAFQALYERLTNNTQR